MINTMFNKTSLIWFITEQQVYRLILHRRPCFCRNNNFLLHTFSHASTTDV